MSNSGTEALFNLLKSIAFEKKKVILASGKESVKHRLSKGKSSP